MMSLNWGKIIKRVVLAIALALALFGTITTPSANAAAPKPLVNWNS